MRTKRWLGLLFVALWVMGGVALEAAEPPQPIRALYVTGGGWHDYPAQERILTEGIAKRILVEWTIEHEIGVETDRVPSRWQADDWMESFDVIVYNICYTDVNDTRLIERIVAMHYETGTPAVMIHCAMHSLRGDTDAWFELLGVRTYVHEAQRPFLVENLVPDHPIMLDFPAEWQTPAGELYIIEAVGPNTQVLAQAYGVDTQRYHPVVWTNEVRGVRVFATTIGHHNVTMQHPVYLDLLSRGLAWAAGRWDVIDEIVVEPVYTAQDGPLREPVVIDFAADGTIFFAERIGQVNQLDPVTGERFELFDTPLSVHLGFEHGLMGMALEPGFDFVEKNHIYLFYSPADRPDRSLLSRFEYRIGEDGRPYLDPASEEVIREFEIWHGSYHPGGDIRFGPDGTLYIALGDNINSFESAGYAPIDRRAGRSYFNALDTASNPRDFRGKILRINPDGSVPEDNPFYGHPDYLGEIWAMGFRNPYRIHVDPVTGWVLIGENGPDAWQYQANRGPAGMAGWMLAWEPGMNFGWPMCHGPNIPYYDWDFAADAPAGGLFDCSGMTPMLVWTMYRATPQFPQLGAGGTSPISGVILRAPDPDAPYQWHAHYLNAWYAADFSRGFVVRFRWDDDGTTVPPHANWYDHDFVPGPQYEQVPAPAGLSVEVFVDGFVQPIDLRQSPDGALYLIVYGTQWYAANPDAAIYRIYNKSRLDVERLSPLEEARGRTGVDLAQYVELGPNLIRNGDLTQFDELGNPVGWGTAQWGGMPEFEWIEGGGYNGGNAFVVRSLTGADAAWTQYVTGLTPGERYRMSAWIKTDDVSGALGAILTIFEMGDVHGVKGSRTRHFHGTNDWTYIETEFTAEHSNVTVLLLLGGWGNSTGTAYFSDVQLREVRPVWDLGFAGLPGEYELGPNLIESGVQTPEGSVSSLDGWWTSIWNGSASWGWIEDGGYQGADALVVRATGATGADAAWANFVTGLVPGEWYRLSAWVKTENVQGALGALLTMHEMDDSARAKGSRTRGVYGTHDWTFIETLFQAEDTKGTVLALLGGWGLSTGTAYFSDVQLRQVLPATSAPAAPIGSGDGSETRSSADEANAVTPSESGEEPIAIVINAVEMDFVLLGAIRVAHEREAIDDLAYTSLGALSRDGLDGVRLDNVTNRIEVPVGERVVLFLNNAGRGMPHDLSIALPAEDVRYGIAASDAEMATGRLLFEIAMEAPVGEGDTFIYVPLDGLDRVHNWVSFVPTRPGTYVFLCGVPGHALVGMIGTLVVTE